MNKKKHRKSKARAEQKRNVNMYTAKRRDYKKRNAETEKPQTKNRKQVRADRRVRLATACGAERFPSAQLAARVGGVRCARRPAPRARPCVCVR